MGTDSLLVVFDPCLGLEEKSIVTQIYPNPFSGELTIKTGSNQPALVTIYNSTGALVISTREIENEGKLDMSAHSKGLYFVSIQLDGTQLWQKIEKN
jgi:hypothetical protein